MTHFSGYNIQCMLTKRSRDGWKNVLSKNDFNSGIFPWILGALLGLESGDARGFCDDKKMSLWFSFIYLENYFDPTSNHVSKLKDFLLVIVLLCTAFSNWNLNFQFLLLRKFQFHTKTDVYEIQKYILNRKFLHHQTNQIIFRERNILWFNIVL